jgi:ubiquinone/menaquinone biosynthesis C-methylase UbiE
VALTLVAGATGALGAQLSTRPADEWAKLLDSPERLAGLRIDDVADRLGLKPGEVVADLGAGTGSFSAAFARRVAPGTAYAVEVDDKFFPYIRQKAQAAGVTNVVTVLGAFTDPKLPTRDVDVAFFHDVLHHIEQKAAYLKALAPYLKPAARIAIVDFHPEHSPHRDQPALLVSAAQTRALLADAGFTQVEEIQLFTDKWFLVGRR